MLVVVEEGKTHSNRTHPRVGEVQSLGDALHGEFCRQQMHTCVVRVSDLDRYFWKKVIQIEGDGE